MKKIRGFLIKHRVISLFRYIRRKTHSPATTYRLLNPSSKSLPSCLKWVARIKSKASAICCRKSGLNSGYFRVKHDPEMEPVPKGKMAFYVGKDDGYYERVLVPVIYINHPLFGNLLRKAEEEYGHDHPGGITIPCRISEFENVKTRIDAVCGGGRKMMTWKRHV